MTSPACHQCNNEMYPLVMAGIGNSISAAAIWGSIPYVVPESAVGSAFGVTTAVINIFISIATTLVGEIKDRTLESDQGFYWVHAFFLGINIFGLLLSVMLYYIDMYHNDRVLDLVKRDGVKATTQNKGYEPTLAFGTEESEPLTRAENITITNINTI